MPDYIQIDSEPSKQLGLLDLKSRTISSEEPKKFIPPSQGLAVSAASQKERGDDLMSSAVASEKVDNADLYQTRLFMESQQMVGAKIEEDQEYAKKVEPEFQRLAESGDDNYMHKMIDEADDIKIGALKRENPEWFNGTRAASYGFLNSISFGQLSKIAGKAGEIIDGTPYEQIVEREAEKVRLLHKAFPGMTLAAEAATFLIPGSPVKALFAKSAGIALKVAGNIAPSIAKLAANPTLLQKTITMAVEGAAGTFALSTAKNTAGTDFQDFSLDRGVSQGVTEAATVGLFTAMLPAAGKAFEIYGPTIPKGALIASKKAAAAVGILAESISGTSTEAIRAYRKNPAIIKGALGTESAVGKNLLDFLWNKKKSRLLEHDAADKLLDSLPTVDGKNVIKFLKGFKKGNDPKLDAQVDLLHEWADRIKSRNKDITKIPARKMRELVDELQEAASDAFGKESNLYMTALKAASRRARIALVDTANELGGKKGKKYSALMEKVADKTRILEFIGKQLGRTVESQEMNTSTFHSKLFGRNGKLMQQRLVELDKKFGTSFMQKFQNAQYAKQLGPQGEPQFFPAQSTGRTQLGSLIGEGTGAVVGGVIGSVFGGAGAVGGVAIGSRLGKAAGTAASSPRMHSLAVGTSDKITGFVGKMLDRPDVLSRLSGEVFKVPGGGAGRMSVPNEVKQIAKELKTTIEKEGPLSAASTTRLIADTPYFLGLVHYFEIAERNMIQNSRAKAVAKDSSENSSEIAKKY